MDRAKTIAKPDEPAQTDAVPAPANDDTAPPAPQRDRRLTHPGDSTSGPRPRLLARLTERLSEAWSRERDYGLGFLLLPVAMGLGAGLYFMADRDPSLIALLAGFATGLLLILILRRNHPLAARALGFAVAMFAGGLSAAFETGRGPVLLDSDVTTTITGVVQAREFDDKGRVRYLIRLTGTTDPSIGRAPGRVRLVARMPHAPVAIGDIITGRARLSSPSGPVLPGGYDFAFRAFVDGIGAHGFFYRAPASMSVSSTHKPLPEVAAETLRRLREGISARIRSVLSGDPGGIAAALAVSDRRGIAADTVEALRATGLAHILAISGLHMALAAGTLYVGLRLVLSAFPALTEAWPVKKFAAGGALITATAYLLISGGSVPTQRAWVMLTVMLVAVLFDRPALTMRNVALAAIVIILITPSAVAGPGFQMSFSATAALIAAYAALSRRSRQRETGARNDPAGITMAVGIPGWLRLVAGGMAGLALTSLVAGLATGLFSAHHFHRVASGGLIANLVAMPLVTLVVMPMGLLALLVMPLGLDEGPLRLMGLGLEGVIATARYVQALGGDLLVGQIPVSATATAGFGFIILVFLRTWLRLFGVALIGAGGLLASPVLAPPIPHILISEDGRLVGLTGNGAIASNATRPSQFVFRQWQTALRGPIHTRPVLHQDLNQDENEPGSLLESLIVSARDDPRRFHCAARGVCAASYQSGPEVNPVRGIIVAIDRADLIGAACDNADLAIVAIPVHMSTCRSGARLITSRMLRRSGSLALSMLGAPLPAGPSTYTHLTLHDGDRVEDRQAEASELLGAPKNGSAARRPARHTRATREGAPALPRPDFEIRSSLSGVVRPWTIQRYYDWRRRAYEMPDQGHDRIPTRP